MNFQSVQYFVMVAKERSFSKAAQRLYVTQPAVSRQIAELEKELGISLFCRNRKGVALTREGEACYSAAKEIVDGCRELYRLAESLRKMPCATIRIGYPNMSALKFLPEKLERLKGEFPEIRVDLLHMPPVEASVLELKKRRIDALVTSETFVVRDSELTSSRLCSGRLAAIAPAAHALAGKEQCCFADLRKERVFIHCLNRSSTPYEILTTDCERSGLKPESFECRERTDEIFMAAAMGQGIGLMPECFLDGRLGALRAVPVADSPEYYGAVMACRSDERNPVLRRLMEL